MKTTTRAATSAAAILSVILLSACTIPSNPLSLITNRKTIQASGNVIRQARSVSGFNAVALSGIGEVTLKQGADESVTIVADDNLAPYLTTDVRDGVLYLGLADGVIFTGPATLRYEVTAKTLTGVQNSGLGAIKGENIDTPALAVDLSGGGEITLRGKADAQRVVVSGLGMINLAELAGRNAIVTVSGAGEARVNATDTLKAEISGLGSVRYAGQPRVERDISGGGDIAPIE